MTLFYHADRFGTLSPGMALSVDDKGLSRFGTEYWNRMHSTPVEAMDGNLFREFCAEQACRQLNFPWSRHACMFAAETIEQAIEFANVIEPRPVRPITIYEIQPKGSVSRHDMTWLTYDVGPEQLLQYCHSYWRGEETNHQPAYGERTPPRWEVLIPMPASVGRAVATVIF